MMRSFTIGVLTLALACALCAPRAEAQLQQQDTLRIVRFDTSAFPKIRVHVRAFCKGVQTQSLQTIDAQVKDGGMLKNFTMRCPPDPVPISVAFALDRSGSVAGTSLYRIQQGAWEFIQLMQPRSTGTDEAAIISFAEDWYVEQSMTSNTNDLYDALTRIFAWGPTAIWDAALRALYEVETFGVNPVKAVIVLSDGGDNASGATLQDVIRYARRAGIPVYTICVSYHALPNEVADMRMLADSTGGVFIPVTHPDGIIDAFNELASHVAGGANDCVFEYEIECPDGSWREAEITVKACNGKTLVERRRYRAPIDPSLPAVTISFDSTLSYEYGDLVIPVRITATGGPANLRRLAFKVYERTPLVTFVDAITAPHLAGRFTSIDIRDVSDSLLVTLEGNVTLVGSDTLMLLRYKAGAVDKDSIFSQIIFDFEKETDDCMQLRVLAANLNLRPRPVIGSICGDTVAVAWDPVAGMYDPAIVTVSASVKNTGVIPAMNTRAWIRLPYGVTLAGGTDTVALGIPMLAAGQSAPISFAVRIAPVDSARTYVICIGMQSDSTLPVECCTVIQAERGRPALRAQCTMPTTIRWIDSLGRYEPEVFAVTLEVTNVSPVIARTPEAWIQLPAGFGRAGSTPVTAAVSPATLTQNQSGQVTWMLRPVDRMTSDTVEFCIKVAAGLDTGLCCQRVFITKSPVRATLACTNPSVITWDEEKQAWDPPMLIASTTVRNTSGNVMTSAQGRISFPSYMRLAPGETVLKDLPGGAVVQPGDSVTISWILAGTTPPSGATQICIDILASNFAGARCCVPLQILTTGAAPQLACTLAGPDTIRYTDSGYDPNPFMLDVAVRNTGTSHGRMVYAALLQGADLSIEGPDQPLKLVTDSLAAGETAATSFRLRVLDRTVARFDTIRVSVYAANGGAMVCEKIVWIEAVRGAAIELTCAGPDSLVFSDSLNTYLPSPFTISLEARNVGNAPADSVVAEFLPPGNIELVAGELSAKLLAPSLLGPGDRGIASWVANAVPRSSGRVDTIRAQVKVKGRTTSAIVPCPVPVYIPAARAAALALDCLPPPVVTIESGRYTPDPIIVRVRIRNSGDARAFDPLVRVITQGRLALAPGESAVKSLATLAPGADEELLWSFTAVPGPSGDTVDICFTMSARFHRDLTCCMRVYLPPLEAGSITLACAAPDTVRFDTGTDRYPNPIIVRGTARNTSQTRVDSVRMTIALPGGIQLSAGETPDRLVRDLDPAAEATVAWNIDIVRDTTSVLTERRVRITAYANGVVRTCERVIVVVPPPRDTARGDLGLTCSAPDSIRYLDPQRGLQPSPFSVTATVHNSGQTQLANVSVTLVPPAGITLVPGEAPSKPLGVVLAPGQQAALSWSCIPAIADTARAAVFMLHADAGGGLTADCETRTGIAAAESIVEIRVPTGLMGRIGTLVDVPLFYRNPLQAIIRDFAVDLLFESSTLEHASAQPRAFTPEWDGVTVTGIAPGRVRVAGASPVPLGSAGVLGVVVLRVTSGDGSLSAFGVRTSLLQPVDPVLPRGVSAQLIPGDITTHGDCILPVKEGGMAKLHPNSPNPFNPVTRIRYALPEGDLRHVVLEVHDAYGRRVRVLDEGMRGAGEHAVEFDASGLPSGVLFYRMTIGSDVLVRAMLLAR